MLKNPDVENLHDFRQYYMGSYVLAYGKPSFIAAVNPVTDTDGMVQFTFEGDDSKTVRYDTAVENMLFGSPILGLREVDGQLVRYACRPERTGRRGYRCEATSAKMFTEMKDGQRIYYPETSPRSWNVLKEVFTPTFHTFTQAKYRIETGLTMGAAITHDLGVFIKPNAPGLCIAFRGGVAGIFRDNGKLLLFPGYERLDRYLRMVGGL